jgi:hypothetical protein
MNEPDSIVEYVRWLDGRHEALRAAVTQHRSSKQTHSIPGSIDEFDRVLWSALDASKGEDDA